MFKWSIISYLLLVLLGKVLVDYCKYLLIEDVIIGVWIILFNECIVLYYNYIIIFREKNDFIVEIYILLYGLLWI